MINRLKSGRVPNVVGGATAPVPSSRYLRDSGGGLTHSRREVLTESGDDIKGSWKDIAAMSKSLIQNAGQLKGAADQVIVDTVGTGLRISFSPDLTGFSMSKKQRKTFIDTVECEYKSWRNSSRECDHRGKLTQDQINDIALRNAMVFGEVTAVHSFFNKSAQHKYGIQSGTKTLLLPPSRLVQESNKSKNLVQGIIHDNEGRAKAYRFRKSGSAFERGTIDYPAIDKMGLPHVSHILDPQDSSDVRGVGAFASALSRILQSEKLDQVTLKMAVLQTNFAISLQSDAPSADAFEALDALGEIGDTDEKGNKAGARLAEDYLEYYSSNLNSAAGSTLKIGDTPHINHMAQGEKLSIDQVGVPHDNYLPFKNALSRETARAIGITASSFSLDYSKSTYSSVRMENATVYPLAVRRRKRIVEPLETNVFTNWLDEQIAKGRIAFPAGYSSFAKRRTQICRLKCLGPAKPTADDYKSAKAANERVQGGQTSLAIEVAENGHDFEDVFEQQHREHQKYKDAGMASPYDPTVHNAANNPEEYENQHGKSDNA